MSTVAGRTAIDRADHPIRGDRGTATISTIVLVPVLLVVMAIGVQAALHTHARTEARFVAQEVAALVGRAGLGIEEARAVATGVLVAETDLAEVEVGVIIDAEIVVVTVRARAPGLVRGTSSPIVVHGVVAREGWRA